MRNENLYRDRVAFAPTLGATFDAGLRRHMLGIYRNMGLALIVSATVAWIVAATPAIYQPIFGTPLKWVAIFAPLAFVFFFSSRFEQMSLASARAALFAFAALMGLSLASVLLVFTGASIATTFLVAAVTFLAMSLWSYTTRADLTRYSTFLFMGLIGVVLASVVNLFLQSGTLQLVVSIIGAIVCLVFAWQTSLTVADFYERGISMNKVWQVPHWLPYAAMPVGTFFMGTEFVRRAYRYATTTGGDADLKKMTHDVRIN